MERQIVLRCGFIVVLRGIAANLVQTCPHDPVRYQLPWIRLCSRISAPPRCEGDIRHQAAHQANPAAMSQRRGRVVVRIGHPEVEARPGIANRDDDVRRIRRNACIESSSTHRRRNRAAPHWPMPPAGQPGCRSASPSLWQCSPTNCMILFPRRRAHSQDRPEKRIPSAQSRAATLSGSLNVDTFACIAAGRSSQICRWLQILAVQCGRNTHYCIMTALRAWHHHLVIKTD